MYDHTVVNSMVQRGREREGEVGLVSVILSYCSKQYGPERENGNILREGEVGGFGLFTDIWSQ